MTFEEFVRLSETGSVHPRYGILYPAIYDAATMRLYMWRPKDGLCEMDPGRTGAPTYRVLSDGMTDTVSAWLEDGRVEVMRQVRWSPDDGYHVPK